MRGKTKTKRVLGVTEDIEFLESLAKEIQNAFPDIHFDKASTFEDACLLEGSTPYDLIALDLTGSSHAIVISRANNLNCPVLILAGGSGPKDSAIEIGNLRIAWVVEKGDLKQIMDTIKSYLSSGRAICRKNVFLEVGDFVYETFCSLMCSLAPNEAHYDREKYQQIFY